MPESSRPEVLLAVPSVEGWVHAGLVERMFLWSQRSGEEFYGLTRWIPIGLKPNDHVRNTVIRHFLHEGEWTHLFMVDHDTVPPPHALDALLRAEKDVISGVTPVRLCDPGDGQMKLVPAVYKWGKASDGSTGYMPWGGTGLCTVDAVGASCLLLTREILTDMPMGGWFRVLFNNQGLMELGQDLSFCEQLHDRGVPIYADFEVQCDHVKTMVL